MEVYHVIVFIIAIYCQLCSSEIARHGMTSTMYQNELNKLVQLGYRLKHVSGYSDYSGRAHYAAIWVKTDGRQWVARHGMDSATYQREFNKWTRYGYRLVLVSGYAIGSKTYYVAIWEKRSGPSWFARHGMTSQAYQSYFNTNTNYRPTYVSGYTVNGVDYYAAIWERTDGRSWVARHRMSNSVYQSEFNKWVARGYRLVLVSGYQLESKDYYAAIWEKISGPAFFAQHGASGINYQGQFDNQYYRGYKLIYVVGYLVGYKIKYAAIWNSKNIWSYADLKRIDGTVNNFLQVNGIPGAALAITKNGKLVFAQGYGKANVESNYIASPKNLWRIASISKPITSVAIMKLKDLGKLKLTDKVFGPGSILGTTYAGGVYSTRERKVTIQHLLEHTAGGLTWNNDGGDGSSDPLFILKSYDHEALIKYILQTREPSAEPGTIYSYSNFGYCILGRVIEKLTGQNYDSWVKSNILTPMGAANMHIGENLKSQKRRDEVVYYSGSSPYSMNVKRMDSHGGWITSPIDLLRLMVHVDGFSTVPDYLNPSTVSTMVTPSFKNGNYAKGWAVNSAGNWWHGGSLPGTMSILVRTSSGYTWTFMCNKRGSGNVNSLMWKVINGVINWPNVNFF